MNKGIAILLIVGAVVLGGYQIYQELNPPAPQVCPGPNCPNNPIPVPPPLKPPPRPCPHSDALSVERSREHPISRPRRPKAESPYTGGPRLADGTEVMADLPVSLRMKNIGGTDGAGLCVFTSIMHSARYQHELPLWNFQEQMSHEPGGGYPAKVDAMIKKYAPSVHYAQAETNDPTCLELALKTDRLPAITYCGRDSHYGYDRSVAHMVNLVYLDSNVAAIMDNNFIEDGELMWMTRSEFLERWRGGDSTGWAVFLLRNGPPPVPLKK